MTTPAFSIDPVAYLNGEFVPLRNAQLPVWDLGIVSAVTVTEALRTFAHQPFRVEQHLSRLAHSLEAIGLKPAESLTQLDHIIRQIAAFNAGPENSDVAVILFVTGGESALHSGGLARQPGKPSVCVYPRPLDFTGASVLYQNGLSLEVPSVRNLPASIIDPRIKHRNRLHWHLADRQVQQADPHAEALLLDLNGFVTETAKGNLFAVSGSRLLTPSPATTLGGISQEIVTEFAQGIGLSCEVSDMTPDDLLAMDEVWVSSTTTCLTPVTKLNGRAIGSGKPGQLWNRLIRAWSDLVGIDIVAQANRLAAS
jgi:branched-subunit amino acid aminotransferase/4-amino-4-deoxychorismate lyase